MITFAIFVCSPAFLFGRHWWKRWTIDVPNAAGFGSGWQGQRDLELHRQSQRNFNGSKAQAQKWLESHQRANHIIEEPKRTHVLKAIVCLVIAKATSNVNQPTWKINGTMSHWLSRAQKKYCNKKLIKREWKNCYWNDEYIMTLISPLALRKSRIWSCQNFKSHCRCGQLVKTNCHSRFRFTNAVRFKKNPATPKNNCGYKFFKQLKIHRKFCGHLAEKSFEFIAQYDELLWRVRERIRLSFLSVTSHLKWMTHKKEYKENYPNNLIQNVKLNFGGWRFNRWLLIRSGNWV